MDDECPVSVPTPEEVAHAKRVYDSIPFGAFYFASYELPNPGNGPSKHLDLSRKRNLEMKFETGKGPFYSNTRIWSEDPEISIHWEPCLGRQESLIYSSWNITSFFANRPTTSSADFLAFNKTLSDQFIKNTFGEKPAFRLLPHFSDSPVSLTALAYENPTVEVVKQFIFRFLAGSEPAVYNCAPVRANPELFRRALLE